jgi:hypothetical protein
VPMLRYTSYNIIIYHVGLCTGLFLITAVSKYSSREPRVLLIILKAVIININLNANMLYMGLCKTMGVKLGL